MAILNEEEIKRYDEKLMRLETHFENLKDQELREFWSAFNQTYDDESIGRERILILKDFDFYLQGIKDNSEHDDLNKKINQIQQDLRNMMIQLIK